MKFKSRGIKFYLSILSLFLVVILAVSIVVINYRVFNKAPLKTSSQAKVPQSETKTFSQEKLTSYWPMNLDNWWMYQNDDPVSCINPAGKPAKTAWWVVPPDLSWRLNYSRQLLMFKEAPCAYNWIGKNVNIRWAVAPPVKDGFGTYWFSHRGNMLYSKNDRNQINDSYDFNPPFKKPNNYFSTDLSISSLQNNTTIQSGVNNNTFLKPQAFMGRSQIDPKYPPYLFFPFSQSYPQEMEYQLKFSCGFNKERSDWNILKGSVPSKCNINNDTNNYPGYWMVKYVKNVSVVINIKNKGRQEKKALKFRVFEPHPKWPTAACENWYFVKGIGPVKIEAIDLLMYKDDEINTYKDKLQISKPSNKSLDDITWLDYARESYKNRCLNFNFSSDKIDLTGNIDSNSYQILINDAQLKSLNQSEKQRLSKKLDSRIYTHRYAVMSLLDYNVKQIPQEYNFQDYDSPIMTSGNFTNLSHSLTDHNHIMYTKNGKYWILNIKTGRWLSYGKLIDAWGQKGSRSPGVLDNDNNVVYPWSNNGPKTMAFGQNIKNMFNSSFIVINKSLYWLWDYCSDEEKQIKLGCIGNWRKSGKLSDLLTRNYPTLRKDNGERITPFTNNGPAAVNQAWWDPYGLEIWNEGGWWYYKKPINKNGKWIQARLVKNMESIKSAPIVDRVKLKEPESVFYGPIYHDSPFLRNLGNPPILSDGQEIYTQNGRYWIKYGKKDWERW